MRAAPSSGNGECDERGREVAGRGRGERRVRCDLARRIAQMHDERVTETAEAEPEVERRSRHEYEIGLPQRNRARPREREFVVGGQRAPSHSIHEHRHPRALGERAHRILRVGPVDVAARDENWPLRGADQRGHTRDGVGVGRGAAERLLVSDRRHFDRSRSKRVERDVDERRTAVGRACGSARGIGVGDDGRRRRRGRSRLRDRRHDRYVVELLQGTRTPSRLGRAPRQHDERRAVHARRSERAHAVRHSRARGQRRAAQPTRHLCETLRRECRALLVPHIDEPEIGLHRAVVEHEEMPARQREHDIDAVPLQHLDREPAAVRLHDPFTWSARGPTRGIERARRSTLRDSRTAASARRRG